VIKNVEVPIEIIKFKEIERIVEVPIEVIKIQEIEKVVEVIREVEKIVIREEEGDCDCLTGIQFVKTWNKLF